MSIIPRIQYVDLIDVTAVMAQGWDLLNEFPSYPFFYFLRVLVNVEYIKFTLNRCPHCSATMIPVKYKFGSIHIYIYIYIYMLCKNKNIRKADEKCASVGFGNSYGIASERAVDIITNCKPRVDKFILSYQVAFLSYFVITCIDTLPKSCWYMFASNN